MKSTIAAALLLLTAVSAHAGSESQPSFEQPLAATDDFSFRFAVYGWIQSFDGDVTVAGGTADLDLKFEDLFDYIDMAFMGAAEVSYGRWGLLVDLNYADVGARIPTPLGIVAPIASYSQEQWMVNMLASYQVMKTSSTLLGVHAGARLNHIGVDLRFNARELSGEQTWIDPVIGLRFQQMLSPSFFLLAAGDIGGFDVSSDLTWQILAGIGWRFNECGSAFVGYRVVDTDYTQGNFEWDLNTHGPILGLEFTF